ncbi:MAG: flagellar motor protein MotB [Candidatus Omnitrophica bacterium]|nr:flagellar motor protein MotB [Candidatus Omnitrophota bacterium]
MPDRKREEEGGGAPEWMCTFSDMMSLLLCFFVLLFSMSSIEQQKFTQAINSIQGALGRVPFLFTTSYVPPISQTPQKAEPVQRNKTIQRAKEAIAQKARSRLVADEKSKEIIVEGVREGIRFSLAGRILFQPGTGVLTTEGKRILNEIAVILSDFPKLRIRIEGHADSSPVPSNSIYRDNWKLAEARALSVMVFLVEEAAPPDNRVKEDRLSFMSCSDNRPRFPNDAIENRSLNRRVEIILLQGADSETVNGLLEGSAEQKIIPDDADFVPMR